MNIQEIDLQHLLNISDLCWKLYRAAGMEFQLLNSIEMRIADEISSKNPSTELPPTVLGNIQAFQVFLDGYISTIERHKIVAPSKAAEIIKSLSNSLFHEDYFLAWYKEEDDRFDRAKNFVRHFDYLRILRIEYARTHKRFTDE